MGDTAEQCRSCTSGMFRCPQCRNPICGRHYTLRGRVVAAAPGGYVEWGEFTEFEVVLDHGEAVLVPLPHPTDLSSMSEAAVRSYRDAWQVERPMCVWCRQRGAGAAAVRQAALDNVEASRRRRAERELELRRAEEEREAANRERESIAAAQRAETERRTTMWPRHNEHVRAQPIELDALLAQHAERRSALNEARTVEFERRERLDFASGGLAQHAPFYAVVISVAWLALTVLFQLGSDRVVLARAVLFSALLGLITAGVMLRAIDSSAGWTDLGSLFRRDSDAVPAQGGRPPTALVVALGIAHVGIALLMPGALLFDMSGPRRLICHLLLALLCVGVAWAIQRDRRHDLERGLAFAVAGVDARLADLQQVTDAIVAYRCGQDACPHCDDLRRSMVQVADQ